MAEAIERVNPRVQGLILFVIALSTLNIVALILALILLSL